MLSLSNSGVGFSGRAALIDKERREGNVGLRGEELALIERRRFAAAAVDSAPAPEPVLMLRDMRRGLGLAVSFSLVDVPLRPRDSRRKGLGGASSSALALVMVKDNRRAGLGLGLAGGFGLAAPLPVGVVLKLSLLPGLGLAGARGLAVPLVVVKLSLRLGFGLAGERRMPRGTAEAGTDGRRSLARLSRLVGGLGPAEVDTRRGRSPNSVATAPMDILRVTVGLIDKESRRAIGPPSSVRARDAGRIASTFCA